EVEEAGHRDPRGHRSEDDDECRADGDEPGVLLVHDRTPCVVATRTGSRSAATGRTTTTGQVACSATCWATEPNSSERKPPRPREPTTTRSASLARSRIACAGWPSTSSPRTGPRPRSRQSSTAASSTRAASTRIMSRSVSELVSVPYPYSQAWTT